MYFFYFFFAQPEWTLKPSYILGLSVWEFRYYEWIFQTPNIQRRYLYTCSSVLVYIVVRTTRTRTQPLVTTVRNDLRVKVYALISEVIIFTCTEILRDLAMRRLTSDTRWRHNVLRLRNLCVLAADEEAREKCFNATLMFVKDLYWQVSTCQCDGCWECVSVAELLIWNLCLSYDVVIVYSFICL